MAGKEVEKESKKEQTPAFELVEVATQVANVIRDNTTNTVLTTEQALVQILNELREVKKGVLG